MSTGTANSGTRATSSAAGASAAPAERERFIERQLRRTRRQVRGVELTSRFLLLAAAAVVFFLVAAVFDHWLIPGGLSIYGRLAFLVVFLLGAGWFAIRELAPLFVYRINPLFAAQTIERAKPTLKNSLLNFLMLRSHRAGVPDVVLSAVEEQAAVNLQRTPIDHVVDHTRLVHLGYLLLAAVAAFCTYYLVSPKSPLQTVGRVVLPWADMQPPSRVEIDDIQPGTTTVFRGQRATISATVRGLQDDEAVTLYFSTADRQNVDQPVRMYVAKDSHGRHAVTLPANDAAALSMTSAGLQQDIEYRIEAGDAVSRTHRLSVIQAPNIVVEKLDYAFPPYTGLEPQTVAKSGDIKAVEGTQVTIHARANQHIAAAYVDLGGGQLKQPMKVSGQRATTTITLALNEERTAPVHSYYHVRFQTDRGHENPEPIRNRIEVTPDPSPELQLLRPDKVEMAVPLNAPVEFELEASDPLYGLSDVRIVASVGSEPAFRRNRAVTKDDKNAARLVYKHMEHLDRITLDDGKKLKPGDVIEYWAEAVDNKSPKPNVTKTDIRKLVIVEPQQQNQNQQPQENNQGEGRPNENQQNGNGAPQNNQPNDRQNKEQPQERGNNDAGNQGEQQPGQNNQKSGSNDQKRGAKEPDAKGAQGDQRNDDKSADQQNQERPQDKTGDKAQQDQPNNADKQDNQRGDQKSGGKANQKDQTGGQESATKDQQNRRNGQQDESQTGDPSADGAGGEQGDPQNNGGQNSAQKGADGQGGASQEDQKPVAQSDEGTAFDRILDHARQQGKSPEQSTESQANQRPAGDEKSAEQKNADNAADNRDESQPPAGKNETTQARKSDQQGDESSAAQSKKDDAANEAQRDATAKENQDEGVKTGEAQNDQSTQQKRGNEKGGSTPAPQEQSRPNTKQSPADNAGAKSEQEEKSPAHSKHNSPKKGQQSGDQNARGKDGGGQNDNRAGSGAKGASDPADQGADAAKEPGAGDTGKKAGDDKTANEKTGGSGDKKGEGTESRPSDGNADANTKDRKDAARDAADSKDGSGDTTGQKQDARKADDQKQPGGEKGKQQPSDRDSSQDSQKGEPGQADSKGESGDQPGDSKAPSGKAAPGKQNPDGRGKSNSLGGGGTPEGDPAQPPDFDRTLPSDDKANLDYAKRATDLALDHLRNQLKKDKPDQELLDRLGWSKDDLQKLLTRWETMQREAQQPGPKGAKAKANFEEAVQSLGIRPASAARRASTKADDSAQGLRDAARSAPPPEYIEGFEAFRKRTSRGD